MNIKKTVLLLCAAVLVVAGLAVPAQAQQRMNNFIMLVDQSMDMNVSYHGKSKHLIARDVSKLFLKHVPNEFPVKGAIYMYGIASTDPNNTWSRIQSFEAFNRNTFLKAHDEMKPANGPASLAQTLIEVRQYLGKQKASGRTAIVIFSGGNHTDKGDPVAQAKAINKAFGKDVCIYTVLIGNDKKGGKLMKELATVGQCGLRSTSDTLDNDAGMERYTKHVFYKKNVQDSDNDGVLDNADQCPNTPFGASVDYRGCWVLNDINFDTGKSEIKPMYFNLLDSVASVMNVNPDLYVTIEGHTDDVGDDAYNMRLSEERANAVKNYLINQGGVDPGRLISVGKGESQPVADNSSAAGKAQNRRIEFNVSNR